MLNPDLKTCNSYYICLPGSHQSISWNIYSTSQRPRSECMYFSRVFQVLEESLTGLTDLTIYLTWSTDTLPSYGENVVVVILGDEKCRVPKYFRKVRAIFKCYGISSTWESLSWTSLRLESVLSGLQNIENTIPNLPQKIKYEFYKNSYKPITRKVIHPIPLGYFNQEDLPLKPLKSRTYDVFFAGSVSHENYGTFSPKRILRTPKESSRARMLYFLEVSQSQLQNLTIKVHQTSSFNASRHASSESYSEGLMNAKVCLVPRGASLETFRFFEGLRYGCVLITEKLPSHWFYQGAPTLEIRDWSLLPQVLSDLFEHPERLLDMHLSSLEWWSQKCSEEATGRFVAGIINELN